jgi:hypothetical protein
MIGDQDLSPSPKVWAMGHRQALALWKGRVIVQEKVDGSQISFMRTKDDRLRIRSKGVEQDIESPDKMFTQAVVQIQARFEKLTPGAIYRGEYLSKPKHNVLNYGRVPPGNIALFDVVGTSGEYLSPSEVHRISVHLQLGCVPTLDERAPGPIDELLLKSYLATKSAFGDVTVEGVVFKNYEQFTPINGDPIFVKVVNEAFKETHKRAWCAQTKKDFIEELAAEYNNQVRWEKGIQHMRENGQLTDSSKDIGPLFKEIHADIEEECADEIKEKLWKQFRKKILKGATFGLPDWYKQRLLDSSLEDA